MGDLSVSKLVYLNTNRGFVHINQEGQIHFVNSLRYAQPYVSFEIADEFAKSLYEMKIGVRYYCIVIPS